MPGTGNALAWDRYAYVKYNPIKYMDPSGKYDIINPHNRKRGYADNNPRTTQQQLEQTYGFTFSGTWIDEEARAIWAGVNAIQNYLDQNLNSSSGMTSVEWITKYLHCNFEHGEVDGNHYVFFGTIHFANTTFSQDTVVHEFGHILDNNVKGFWKPFMIVAGFGGTTEIPIRYSAFDATINGGGPADELFIAMGGIPTGLRFSNGASSYPWENDIGVMASLPEAVKFERKEYANHSSADYFAETWAGAIIGPTYVEAPPGALSWMNNFISTLP